MKPFIPTDDQRPLVEIDAWRPLWDDTLEQWIVIPPPVPLEFVPHDSAPLFSTGEEGHATLDDLIKEITSQTPQINDEIRELIRQASLVSLYFFLKYIAGAYGPYADLSDHLHVDVANFRQRMLHAGARGAVFLPRSFYKSTVCTHGAISWELLRDPDLRVGLCASNSDMAEQFMLPSKLTFEDNPLVEYLFPEHCARKGIKGNVIEKVWNSQRIIMPNRTIRMPEPSIKCMGAGGSVAGNHFDLLSVDDLVSEKELDSDRGASADMMKKAQWFSSNQETLLVSPRKSRVFLSATRYAINDPYEQVFSEVKSKHGYWDELPYKVNKEIGVWDIYYRMAVEQDKYVFPEKVGKPELERIRKKDPWAYYTQYLNNPFSASVSEFNNMSIKKCELDYAEGRGMTINFFSGGEHKVVPLSSCEVIIGIDPAASEVKTSNKTSRSAIVVRARDAKDRHYYIDGAVGYFSPTQLYDNIFKLAKRYRKYLRSTNFEAQGGFKFVYNSLVEEQRSRRESLKLRSVTPLPDKDGKIRNFIEPLLVQRLVFATSLIEGPIKEELELFPGGLKRDTLDAMEIADRFSVKPRGQADEDDMDEFDRHKKGSKRRRTSNAVGY